jgi:hypothetical protein
MKDPMRPAAMLLLAAALHADPLKPESILLARIRVVMAENLQRLPNYTCLQTIERARRPAPTRKFQLMDTLRLEVALVGGKELFSWPGAGQFEERELRDFVGGTSGNGSFGLHARAVFLSNVPRFTWVGERERNGRKTVRFDYEVPLLLSGFQLRVGDRAAVVGYRGSFWADAATLDLVRLEVHAVDIPPHLGLQAAGDSMEYARVPIGEGDFLLPESSELSMLSLDGSENVNRTRFSACRQYTGESVIRFDEAPETSPVSAAPPPPAAPIELPEGVTLDAELEAPLRIDRAMIGDRIAARLRLPAKLKGEVLLSKGARVHGRIVRLERWRGGDYYLLGIRLESVESGGRRGPVHAEMVDAGSLVTSSMGRRLAPALIAVEDLDDRGVGLLRVNSRTGGLPKGFHIAWRTGDSAHQGKSRNGDKQ